MKDNSVPQVATRERATAHRKDRKDYTPDDGISIRCVTTANRHGHTRRAADGCQTARHGGGTVGCPDCPYKPPKYERNAAFMTLQ